jgi:hypothetical protein
MPTSKPSRESIADILADMLPKILNEEETPERCLVDLIDSISRGLRQRYWSQESRDEVVVSAYGSFLRRARDGEFTAADPKDLARVLFNLAANKARRKARAMRREQTGHLVDPVAADRTPIEMDVLGEEHARKEHAANQMIQTMRAMFKEGHSRRIFDYFLNAKLARLQKRRGEAADIPDREQIAAELGVSVRTVGRNWQTCKMIWSTWVDDLERILGELDSDVESSVRNAE